jgi:hypothetical protein
MSLILASVVLAVLAVQFSSAAATVNLNPVLWHDGVLYGTVATPTDLPSSAPQSSFDKLYNFGQSGLSGQRSVIESAPGFADFNGGRWLVMPVTFTQSGLAVYDTNSDGVIDVEFMSMEQVDAAADAGYVVIADPVKRFVCTVNKLN